MNIDQAIEYAKENWKGDSILEYLDHSFDKNETDSPDLDQLKRFMGYGKDLWMWTTIGGLRFQYESFLSTVGIIWFFRNQEEEPQWNLDKICVSKD